MHESDEILRAKLNAETGKIGWQELERHFARGVVVRVAGDLDMVEVALRMAQDDKDSLARWLQEGRVSRATPEHATTWHACGQQFWAVVVAPWVLVQEVKAHYVS